MSTSKISTTHHGRFLHSALAAAALMACSVVAQAADPAIDANATATTKTEMNGEKVEKAVSDTWITTKVKSELLADSATKGFKVHVTTKRGVVALTGKLPTQEAVDQVKALAANVKGVHSVDVSGLVVANS